VSDRLHGTVKLGDVRWGGADLTGIDWYRVKRLGDERSPRAADQAPSQGIRGLGNVLRAGAAAIRPRNLGFTLPLLALGAYFGALLWRRLRPRLAVVRAYRQLAAALREQGMADEADRFAYRALVCQRGVLLRRLRLPHYLFSWFLWLIAGYGYRPLRTAFWYVAPVATFATLYAHFGMVDGHSFNVTEAVVFSVTSFHGRGFFPGTLKLDDPVTVMAAVEAVLGLFVEISFITTFTQRYFGSR